MTLKIFLWEYSIRKILTTTQTPVAALSLKIWSWGTLAIHLYIKDTPIPQRYTDPPLAVAKSAVLHKIQN